MRFPSGENAVGSPGQGLDGMRHLSQRGIRREQQGDGTGRISGRKRHPRRRYRNGVCECRQDRPRPVVPHPQPQAEGVAQVLRDKIYRAVVQFHGEVIAVRRIRQFFHLI